MIGQLLDLICFLTHSEFHELMTCCMLMYFLLSTFGFQFVGFMDDPELSSIRKEESRGKKTSFPSMQC